MSDVSSRLASWFAGQLPDAQDVRVEGLDHASLGHSSETLLMTVVSHVAGEERRQDVVVRQRPPAPGLLEPYDLPRQFEVLKGLEGTDVRAPRALWIEPTGSVLGREFFVMERLDGEVWEQQPIPPEMEADGSLRRMCESMVDQLAAIHLVDLKATGLHALGDGHTFVERELAHWTSEMRRVQRGPLPAMERLLAELHQQRPEPCPTVTLVHGDPKPGNFGFKDDEVSAVYDWELTTVGDPLADVGYLELLWAMPVGITSKPSSLTVDEFVARWEHATGITAQHRNWYLGMQVFKINVIQLVASMLFDAGYSDDPRAMYMAMGIEMMNPIGLKALGVTEELDNGPIYPREERMNAAKSPRPGQTEG
ncbi:MAG: phosphotransferase family protein [Acidimicrobiales bacterium]